MDALANLKKRLEENAYTAINIAREMLFIISDGTFDKALTVAIAKWDTLDGDDTYEHKRLVVTRCLVQEYGLSIHNATEIATQAYIKRNADARVVCSGVKATQKTGDPL